MIAGERPKTIGSSSYSKDPLYAFGKAFTEVAHNILTTEAYEIYSEPNRAMRSSNVVESLKDFFCEDFVNESDPTKTPEEIEEEKCEVKEQFENDMQGVLAESDYMSEYSPMVGMALPIHKLILMNNVFSQGGGIQKVTAVAPSFTISLERRILVTPDGQEIDMFLEQNKIAGAIDSTAPLTQFELDLPQTEETDIVGQLGGSISDELSVETHVSGIYIENVYIGEGDPLPDEDGWFTTKGKVATAAEAGLKNVWYHVNIPFTPSYGGPNRLERVLSRPITIRYKTNADGEETVLTDTLFGSMHANKITLTAVKGNVTKIRLNAKLSTTNANMDECSVRWKVDSDYIEIPEANPINTTITPEEVKDVAAMYDVNQVTKILSITKTALSEYKDYKIKKYLDDSYARMDERNSFLGEFDFAVPEGYALDWVTYRSATFMDYFDDFVTQMLQVLNDMNMTVTIYGDPRIVRKITPAEYTYQAPSSIGPVVLDYTQTIVNTKDQRVYNFVGSDKMRNANELMVLLNPRNSDRICYRIYEYQMYISNEIRNANNPALPAIHAFDRWKMIDMLPVQGRINILHPSGMNK